jgi:hypothetical protein
MNPRQKIADGLLPSLSFSASYVKLIDYISLLNTIETPLVAFLFQSSSDEIQVLLKEKGKQ